MGECITRVNGFAPSADYKAGRPAATSQQPTSSGKESIIYNYLKMDTFITAKLLDQIGLLLGFISGFLLIPEIINFLPLMKLQSSIEHGLHRFENFSRFPLNYSPPSWKTRYTEEQREAIEPFTSIVTFIFTIAWMAMLVIGILFSSNIPIILSFGLLIVVTFRNVRRIYFLWPHLSVLTLISMFIVGLFMLAIITPPVSLVRVVLLILRSIITRVYSFFSIHDILRTSLTLLAIILFIISNILQFLATLL